MKKLLIALIFLFSTVKAQAGDINWLWDHSPDQPMMLDNNGAYILQASLSPRTHENPITNTTNIVWQHEVSAEESELLVPHDTIPKKTLTYWNIYAVTKNGGGVVDNWSPYANEVELKYPLMAPRRYRFEINITGTIEGP